MVAAQKLITLVQNTKHDPNATDDEEASFFGDIDMAHAAS